MCVGSTKSVCGGCYAPNKCGTRPVSGWPVVPVRPWSRFFSVDDLSRPICCFQFS